MMVFDILSKNYATEAAVRHVEGGRRPIERFEASLEAGGIDPYARQRFYADNFVDLMGAALAAVAA